MKKNVAGRSEEGEGDGCCCRCVCVSLSAARFMLLLMVVVVCLCLCLCGCVCVFAIMGVMINLKEEARRDARAGARGSKSSRCTVYVEH